VQPKGDGCLEDRLLLVLRKSKTVSIPSASTSYSARNYSLGRPHARPKTHRSCPRTTMAGPERFGRRHGRPPMAGGGEAAQTLAVSKQGAGEGGGQHA
jgi:hypothetical protein